MKKHSLPVTADHGEALGEHNIYYDHKGLYDQTMHVPLLFRYPGRLKPNVLDGLVGSVDIMPTMLDMVGVKVPKAVRGQSLLPFCKSDCSEINARIYGEHVNDSQVMIRTQEWKFIQSFASLPYHEKFRITKGDMELYNVGEDPNELVNVAQDNPELVSRFSKDIDTWLTDTMLPPRTPENLMDEESKETLRALGYVE